MKKEIDFHEIKLQVLLNDVEKYLSKMNVAKAKRDNTKHTYLNLKQKVVGRYASYNDVIHIKILAKVMIKHLAFIFKILIKHLC